MKYKVLYFEQVPHVIELAAASIDDVEHEWFNAIVDKYEHNCKLSEVVDETGRKWVRTAYSRELMEISR